MSLAARSPKALKRALKELKAREQLASTWLVRLGLFLALAAWAYDEYYGRVASGTQKAPAQGTGKQLLLYVGGAMGVGKLALRWHFMRERKELDEQLLSDESDASRERRTKPSKRDKRR